MKKLYITDLREAEFLGRTSKEYLRGNCAELIRFFPADDGIKAAIDERAKINVDRDTLVKVLLEQNKNASEKTIRNIESLKNVNSFTITTGHQLCLFTGPLYFIYKIVHAIKLSDELNQKYADKHFVPVYWMASEDHDFEEISELNLFGKKLKWEADVRGAVGRIDLQEPNQLKTVMEQLKSILGESDPAKKLMSILEKCYSAKNLAEATRSLVNYLFSEFGLVVIDADRKELKSVFADIFCKEIEEEFVIKAVKESSAILEKKGLKVQVTPREINIFYLSEGNRERIVFENDLYFTADFKMEWTKTRLLAEIKLHPENFSPNVLMRGMYQERVLPNLVYIGGGGEISYWLQMKKMFEAAGIFFPVLMIRNSFLLIDNSQLGKIKKLNLEVTDFFKSEEDLIKQFLEDHVTTEIELTEEKKKLAMVFEMITAKLAGVDATLKSSGEAEMQKALKSIEHLEAKIRRAEKQKHETSLNQLKQIKSKLFPGGSFQERHDNFIPYYLKNDNEFIRLFYENMSGMKSELIILS